ncbi:MAG TPA: hypothetical protein VIP11_22795 [Gemmatimonadaceae bacterium]
MAVCRRRFRVFALIWGVLQFALPFAVLLADASTTRGANTGPATHVEASTTPNCPPAHADECALCRFLSNNSAPIARAELVPVSRPALVGPIATSAQLIAAAGHRLPESRAPPSA